MQLGHGTAQWLLRTVPNQTPYKVSESGLILAVRAEDLRVSGTNSDLP